MFGMGDKPWYDDRGVLSHRKKQRAYKMWSHIRTHADWEEYRVTCHHAQLVYVDAKRAFTERSKSLLNASKP